MARSVNKVILIGNLGKDAEQRFTPGGIAVNQFSVATTRRWKDQQSGDWKEETNWTDVVFWRSENVHPYLTKGQRVYVEGRLQSRSYEAKDGTKRYVTEVVAEEVMLLGGRGGDAPSGDDGGRGQMASGPRGSERPATRPSSAASPADDPFAGGVSDDDVPF